MTPWSSLANHDAESSEAGDDLVEDQQGAVLVAQPAQAREVLGGRGVHAAGADDRLGDDRGDLVPPVGEQRPGRVQVVMGDDLDIVEQASPAFAVERQALQRGAADVGAVVAQRA